MGRPRKEKKEIPSFTMPTDPKQISDIQAMIIEIAGYHADIKARREDVKGAIEAVEHKFAIPPEVVKEMVKTFIKDNYEEKEHKNTLHDELFARLFPKNVGHTEQDV